MSCRCVAPKCCWVIHAQCVPRLAQSHGSRDLLLLPPPLALTSGFADALGHRALSLLPFNCHKDNWVCVEQGESMSSRSSAAPIQLPASKLSADRVPEHPKVGAEILPTPCPALPDGCPQDGACSSCPPMTTSCWQPGGGKDQLAHLLRTFD